jgi:hypothetical protein
MRILKRNYKLVILQILCQVKEITGVNILKEWTKIIPKRDFELCSMRKKEC